MLVVNESQIMDQIRTVDPFRDDRGQAHRRQLADPRYQSLALLVLLADHTLRFVTRIIVERFLEPALDDAAFLLDD